MSALSAEVGNITNIIFFEPNEEHMPCFVTFCCEQAKLRARERERERERERQRNSETQKPSKNFARDSNVFGIFSRASVL